MFAIMAVMGRLLGSNLSRGVHAYEVKGCSACLMARFLQSGWCMGFLVSRLAVTMHTVDYAGARRSRSSSREIGGMPFVKGVQFIVPGCCLASAGL